MPYKLNIWDYLFYGSLIVLAIWTILKSVGIIQTPAWIQYGIPLSSFIVGVFALYYNLLKTMTNLNVGFATLSIKFDGLEKRFDKLETKVDHINRDVHNLKTDVVILTKDVGILKADVGILKSRT